MRRRKILLDIDDVYLEGWLYARIKSGHILFERFAMYKSPRTVYKSGGFRYQEVEI